jgi:flagellin-specific chaperone FliS
MPYILKEHREKFKDIINLLVATLNEDHENLAGNLNYVISTLLKRLSKELRYKKANELMGVIECVKQEYYRKIVGPYEDEAIKRNGDIE